MYLLCIALSLFFVGFLADGKLSVITFPTQSFKDLPVLQCPDVISPVVGSTRKTSHARRMELKGIKRLCCPCNPGYRVQGLCEPGNMSSTQCVLCQPGTYISEFCHSRTTCTIDTKECPLDRVKIPSTPSQPSRCDCFDGFYKSAQGTCKPFSSCGPGYGVVRLGTPFKDTYCQQCYFGYEAPSESTTERCTLKESLRLQYEKRTLGKLSTTYETKFHGATIQPTAAESQTNACNTSVKEPDCSGFYVCCVILILLIIVILIAFFTWKHCKKKGHFICRVNLDALCPERSAHQKQMHKVREICAGLVRLKDVNRMIRTFGEQFSSSENPEQLITDNQGKSTREQFNCAFTELMCLGRKKFNPTLLHDFFVKIGNKDIAETLHPFLDPESLPCRCLDWT